MRQRSDEGRRPARRTAEGRAVAERHQSLEETAAPASAPAGTDETELEADIRLRAYERYLSRGDGPGSDVEDWCAAEREVREARQTTGAFSAFGSDREP